MLACSIYVDLNVIHAGIVNTPEESAFTSAFDRIRSRWKDIETELDGERQPHSKADSADWLAPIYLDESADAYKSVEAASTGNPVGSPRISDKGFLPITIDQYLSLLDIVGRVLRTGKQGRIPPDLPPIVTRLKLDPSSWLESLLGFFAMRPSLAAAH